MMCWRIGFQQSLSGVFMDPHTVFPVFSPDFHYSWTPHTVFPVFSPDYTIHGPPCVFMPLLFVTLGSNLLASTWADLDGVSRADTVCPAVDRPE